MSCKNSDEIFFPHFLGGCFFFNSTTGQKPELPGQKQQVLLVSGTHTMIEKVQFLGQGYLLLLNEPFYDLKCKYQFQNSNAYAANKTIYIKMQAFFFGLRVSFISFQPQFRLHIISHLMLPTLP